MNLQQQKNVKELVEKSKKTNDLSWGKYNGEFIKCNLSFLA